MYKLEDALTAKEAGDVERTREIAISFMVLGMTEAVRMRAACLYAWVLGELSRHDEALHLWGLLQRHYTRRDGMLSFMEASMIIKQILALRELERHNDAAVMLEGLLRRVDKETYDELTVKIRQSINSKLSFVS